MTQEHERKCWNCGSTNMEPVETWYRCRDCGATYVDLPKPGDPIVEPRTVLLQEHGELVSHGAQHPTKTVQRQAARAREKKGS